MLLQISVNIELNKVYIYTCRTGLLNRIRFLCLSGILKEYSNETCLKSFKADKENYKISQYYAGMCTPLIVFRNL